ncbi:unnamed protein product [Lampetra fluviatilis]
MNAEEMELLNDPKYRSYAATLDKALKSFEYSSEWADLISALGKLNKVLQGSSKYPVLPRKLTIGKRLAQCLHPALPSGVHLKALETYEIIFRIIGSKRLARDLFLYSAGLFPLLANAAMSVRPALLQLYETYYVPLGKTLKPGLQGLVTAILPGLEEGSEYYDRSNCLLEKTSLAVEPCVFFSALWGSVLTSPAVRLPAVTYTLTHLNRKLSMEDQLHVIGTDVDLMVEAVCACVQDSSVLVQRSTLDLLLFCFPFHHSQVRILSSHLDAVTKLDTVRLLSAVLHVVLRRDMSLNRRLYAWLLGFDNNGTALGPRMARDESREEHGARYFSTYSRELLVQAMVGILKGRGGGGCGEEGGSVSPDLRPFRILLSLLDKPEIGPAILEEVLVEVFRALHGQCEMELGTGIQPLFSKDRSQLSSKMRENKQTAEVVKTANLLFNSFEPYYLWDYLARLFQSCCRRSRRGVRRARRPSGMSEQELTVCELCVLADFLLDVVSLESYIEIQTEHLPRLLRRLIGCLTRHLASLSLTELTDSLRLCSKILSRVQPPLVPYSGGRGEHPGAGTGSRERQEGGARESPKELHGCSDGAGSGSERSRSSSESPPAARRRPGDPARHDGALAGTGDADPDEDEEEGEEEEVDDGGEEVYKDSDDDEGDEGERRQRQHKTTMQRCCERFQEFLTLFSRRYVLRSDGAPAQFVRDISLGGALTGAGALAVWGKRSGRTADGEAGGGGPRGEDDGGSDGTAAAAADGFSEGHLAALAAACQLLLECSSFPVYVAEGSPASPHRALPAGTGDTTGVLPEWLQTLLACCCYGCGGGGGGSDAGLSGSEAFPVRGTAIACFLDLLHLARSVSAVAVSSPQQPGARPASPGRVAVVIVPPLTDAHLRYLAEKTRFFQMVAAILWAQLGEGGGGRHHRRCVELLQQLHGLAPGPSVCEDVVSRDLASRVPATRVEAYRKFALLWHLTRDLQQSKNWAFTRTFDRSLLLMLDSLRCVESDGQCASVCHEWLTHAVQRHDVPRLLEPPLLLLLHPKTQRVSLAAVALRQSGAGTVCVRASGDHAGYYVTERVARGGSSVAHGGPRVPVGLTVNPLGADSESPLSSSPPSASHAKEGPGAADDEDDGGCGDDDDDTGSTHGVSTRSRSDSGVSDRTGDSSLADEEVDEADEADEDEEEEEGRVVCRDIDPEVDSSSEEEEEEGDSDSCPPRRLGSGASSTAEHLRRSSASVFLEQIISMQTAKVQPCNCSLTSLLTERPPRSHRSRGLFGPHFHAGQMRWIEVGPARGGPHPAAETRTGAARVPRGECGGAVSPRATRRMGGGNHGNAAAPSSSLGVTERSVATVHPLYQHVLLYLQVYDTGRVLHALAVLGSVLRSIPAAFVSALATTGVSGARAPRLVLLQNLLARHRASFTGGDFYASAHGRWRLEDAGGFRNAMYLEVVLSLGLAFLRSYYPHHVRASPRQLSENRHVQLASAEVLTLLVSALARLVDSGCTGAGGTGSASSSGPGFASFLLDLLARCKAQKVVLHCLVAGVAGAHARAQAHVLSVRNDPAAEEGLSMEGKVNFFEDGEEEEEESGEGSAGASGEGTSGALQAQLLRLLQALMVLEHKVLACTEDPEGGFTELVAAQPENPPSNHQQHQQEHQQHQQEQAVGPAAPTSLRFVSSRPLAEQEMLGWAVTRALLVSAPPGRASCAAHPRWVGAVTASLPYLGRALARLAVAVVAQVCRNLDAAAQQHAWESALAADRPDVLLESVPPDYVLCLLEGLTTVVHYCLLDSSTTHIHVRGTRHARAEARAAMLCVLPCVLSTAALLWSLLGKAEGQRVEVVAGVTGGAAAPSSVGLGSTKILRQKVLDLLSPLSLQHGVAFMAAVARVWSERTRGRPAASRSRVLAAANVDQQLLVDLIRGISSMRTDSVVGTVKEVVRQPPSGPAPSPKEQKSVPLEVSVLQFFFAYVQRIAVSQFVDSWPSLLSLLKDCSALNLPPPGHFLLLGILNEFVMKMPPMESKKDLRDLQDVTQRLVEAVTHVAGSSLEQTTWLRRNLEVKAGPQVTVDAAGLQADADDALLLSPVAEVVSQPPSVFSVHALTLLAEVLAHLLDMVFRSDEKEKVVPLLINIMYYVVPYLKNHSAHNAPSFRACVQLLSSLSGYQYTRRAWKKEALDLFMESTFFQMDASCVPQWRSIIDHLMTHDKTTFRDLMTRVTVAQSSSLNLFGNREAELEQRVMLLKRLAFSVFSSEVDQYHKFLPDIQERLVESLRLPQVPTLHAQVFLFFRVLLLRVSHQHLTALWPAMITELVQVFMQMEQELMAEDDITRSASPSITGLETTYVGGNGFSSSYSQQRWLALYLSACKFLDLALALPSAHLPQFQLYRWAFIPETCDDSGLEVRRQGNHQREFRPYVVRLTKLLRKKCKKSSEEEGGGSPRMIPCEAGQPLLTVASLRSIDQLLPFFSTLSHFFCNKPMVGAAQHAGSGESGAGAEAQWSRARRRVEETVGRDFLETLNKG